MSALTINKIFCFFFLLFLRCHLVSQDKTYTKVHSDSLGFLESAFGFLSIREGGKTDAVIVAGIFGGVSVGFATSAVINNVKFLKKKRELLKQLALK